VAGRRSHHAGGELDPATIITAYRTGIFPMEVHVPLSVLVGGRQPRGIVPLDHLRVTRSMRQSAKQYDVRVDTASSMSCTAAVIQRARTAGSPEPHRRLFGAAPNGLAHSVEVFDRAGQLAGGLYGVRINGCSPANRCFTYAATPRRWR